MKKERAEITEEKCNSTYNVDDARKDTEVNKYTEWFITKIVTAILNKEHCVKLTSCMYCTNEEYAALYDLENKGYRIERVKRHYDDKNGGVIEDSFYAFW